MGKAEIMLKVLSSPDVDAASITAMLGDSSDDPVVQQLLALRAGWDALWRPFQVQNVQTF